MHPITVKYYECCGDGSSITLYWIVPGGSEEIVPPSALFPTPVTTPPTVHITANPATHDINVSTNFTFTANPVGSWGNNISYSWSLAYEKCVTAAVILTGQTISQYLDVACGNATISVIAEDEKNNTANDTYLVTVHENVTPIPTPTPTFNISGYKINGTDNNGMGISNWTIDLSNATGAQIASTTTDSTGFYIFSNLTNGTYTVNEVMEPNWTNMTPTSQTLSISGADVNSVNFTNALIPSPPIPQPPPPPAPTFSITGTVFIDSNQDGVQDNGEQGYSGATVNLTTNQSVTTDANGNYKFSNLPSATYVVALTVPDGYKATTQSLVNIELNGNAIQNFGIVQTTITPPQPIPPAGSISGYKIDAATGMGLPDWNIQLIGTGVETYKVKKETTTNDQGFYSFENLPAGPYLLVETLKGGYVPTTFPFLVVNLENSKNSMNNNFTNNNLLGKIVPPTGRWPDLDKMKAAGVKWVRVDVNSSDKDGGNSINFVKAAQARGIKVLAIIKSNDFQPYISYSYLCGLKLCFYDWGKEWQNYVKKTVTELKPYNVTDWQIDNELNNFLLTALNNPANNPAQYTKLREDIIKEGVSAAKSADPDGIIWVNLYYSDLPQDLQPEVRHVLEVDNDRDINLYADLRNAGTKIDILGLDIYRGSYSKDSPEQYAKDFIDAHSIWKGDMAMTETGYYTAPVSIASSLPPHSVEGQRGYVKQVFDTLLPFEDSNKWYKGTFIYEYKDENFPYPIPILRDTESTFGLVYQDGVTPKRAWDTFKEKVSICNEKAYICGLAYHI